MTKNVHQSPLSTPLKKQWFVLRHGRSEANEAGIVASQLANAGNAYGLTETGRSEVESSVQQSLEKLQHDQSLRIIASPFLRTLQTAEIAGEILGIEVETDHRLTERDFGDYELLSDDHYENVWKVDPTNPENVPGGTESVYSVTERVCDLILEEEENGNPSSYLLVSHCDVAMILTCAFQNLDPRHHRSLDPIKTGEVRLLNHS